MGINLAAHPFLELYQNTDLTHLSQWELPLELLCPDSCCASKRIFSMSPLWREEEGTCSSPPFFPLPLSLPLLLFMGSSTQELLRPAGSGRDCSPFSQLLLCGGSGCSTKWDDVVRWLKSCSPEARTFSSSQAATQPRRFLFKGKAIMDYKQSNDMIRLFYKAYSSSLQGKTKCRKGELYSGPEQNKKDVPIERQFGAGCLSPSGVQKVPTWRRDSRNTGTYVTNWLHI